MASVRITQFGGLMPEVSSKLIRDDHAQIAHNCLLTDGTLRPQAQWVFVDTRMDSVNEGNRGIVYDKRRGRAVQFGAFDPVALEGQPFAEGYTVGPYSGEISLPLVRFVTGPGNTFERVWISPDPVNGQVVYTRSYDSDKPVNRIYAVSRVRKYDGRAEEGALWVLPNQDPRAVLYEGDLVDITITPDAFNGVTHYRIYRSITGLDTGQALTNDLDTNWHLVDEIPMHGNTPVRYIDGSSATASPLDVAYTTNFHPLEIKAQYFGLTTSGWFVACTRDGLIQVSERYMHHAWPAENTFKIPETITDMVVQGDNVYFGTTGVPYIMALSMGEKGVQGKIDDYSEHMPCKEGSMTATPYGAMYASTAGLVALSRDGLEMVTREIANAGTVFSSVQYAVAYDNPEYTLSPISFGDTGFGYYHAGQYIGFCFVPPPPRNEV